MSAFSQINTFTATEYTNSIAARRTAHYEKSATQAHLSHTQPHSNLLVLLHAGQHRGQHLHLVPQAAQLLHLGQALLLGRVVGAALLLQLAVHRAQLHNRTVITAD
jgi:hypothetical protein